MRIAGRTSAKQTVLQQGYDSTTFATMQSPSSRSHKPASKPSWPWPVTYLQKCWHIIRMIKVAPKYGISAVALGKVCDKLQISLPGRGYWTKKEFGKRVERLLLPPGRTSPSAAAPKETPGDPEFLQVVAVESRNTAIVHTFRQAIESAAHVRRFAGHPDPRSLRTIHRL
jgi:hypothetical protein